MHGSVVVVGGGMAGLTAAHHLVEAEPDLSVTLIEAGDRVGGKLRREEVGGLHLDVGAESMLNRSAIGHQLVEAVGLADDVVHPEPVAAQIWSRGGLHAVPRRTFMGVPAEAGLAAGLLTEDEVDRAQAPRALAPVSDDISVAEAIGSTFGPAVVERLVEPLLGGVYAGRADQLSARSTMAPLWPALHEGRPLPEAIAAMIPAPAPDAPPRAPMLFGLRGGVASLPERLGANLVRRGVAIHTSTIVRAVERTATGWRVVTGPTIAPVAVEADAVVLALPATPTSRLLTEHAPGAAAALAAVDHASMAVITLVLVRRAGDPAGLTGSGFLVPAGDGRRIKASTFSTRKWAWVGEDAKRLALRASVGRAGEVGALQRADEDLVADALADITEAIGGPLPHLIDSHVQRWGAGLPQYTVGHHQRVAAVRSEVADLPGLTVAGATYDGVGVAAVVASGQQAAVHTLAYLSQGDR
ncbi:protoporphyrinogen oxidase [Janibacter sp. GXQ6167]|uniref:protoporphyrinogen oxidase n=1 Tax=Janibacter sp. GXQ6167 TaxID=3240791 RepID=UPI0035252B04